MPLSIFKRLFICFCFALLTALPAQAEEQKNGTLPPALETALSTLLADAPIVSGTNRDLMEAWRAVLAACPDVEATTSLGSNIELNAPGVTKGSGLLALAEKLGLRRDQVMAVGDSGNDLSMIEDAGLGVAMGNATPEILAAADAVTADNNHDGVALAIEKYALHR